MIRKHFFWLLLLFCQPLWSQVQQLEVQQSQLSFELVVDNGSLALKTISSQGIKDLKTPLIMVEKLSLNDGDLILDFRLAKTENSFFYDLHPFIKGAAGETIHPGPVDLRGDFNKVGNSNTISRQFIWGDVTENILDLGQAYTFLIRTELWGDPGVNCQLSRPVFTLRQQLPYYGGAIVGLSFLGVAQIAKSQADSDYAEYRRLWEMNQSKEAADTYFSDAADENKKSETLSNIGLAVLAVDAILYFRQLMAIKKRQKRYDQFCPAQESKNFSFHPFYTPSKSDQAGEQYGISLTYKF